MKYKKGDKIKIRSWEELIKLYEVNYFKTVESEAIKFPDGLDFSRGQYDRLIEKCPDLVDEIEYVNETEWYHLKNSKVIVLKYAIEYEIINGIDCINNRFDILDL